MSKKRSFILSLISILSPVLLIVLLLLVVVTENYFRARYMDVPFIGPFLLWMVIGWIIGLSTGIASLVNSIKLKKEGIKVAVCFTTSIIGIVLNVAWLLYMILSIPVWMSV